MLLVLIGCATVVVMTMTRVSSVLPAIICFPCEIPAQGLCLFLNWTVCLSKISIFVYTGMCLSACVCPLHVWCLRRSEEVDPLGLELHEVASSHVGAGNPSQILCEGTSAVESSLQTLIFL